MGSSAKDDLSTLYENMARFDFKRPFSIVIEECDYFSFDNITNIAQEQQITNGGIYRKENEVTSVHNQNENITQNLNSNKENFNNNIVDTTTLDSQNTMTPYNSQTGTNFYPHPLPPYPPPPYPNPPPHWISEVLFNKHQDTIPSQPLIYKQASVSSEQSQCNRAQYSHAFEQFIQNKDQLNTLSMNLVNVLIQYNHYQHVANSSRNSYSRKCNAKFKFKSVKQYYFEKSREIFMRLILAQKHNKDFVRHFLETTKQFAINKGYLSCTYKDVELIYYELMSWLSSPTNREISQTLIQNTQPQIAVNTTNNNNINFENNWYSSNNTHECENSVNGGLSMEENTRTCLFAYGNPGNEISVTVNTDVSNSLNRQRESNSLQENVYYEYNTNQLQRHIEPPNSLNVPIEPNAAVVRQCPARSVSRDSGFISPVNRQNDDCFNEGQTDEGLEAPYITHVTSLNPKATHVPPGICHVCGARSSQKCLGCFKVYYCSASCQSMDWNKHRVDCQS